MMGRLLKTEKDYEPTRQGRPCEARSISRINITIGEVERFLLFCKKNNSAYIRRLIREDAEREAEAKK